jgi:hypothetical protein
MALPNFGNGEVSSGALGEFTKTSFPWHQRFVFENACSCQGDTGDGASKVDSNNVVMALFSPFRSCSSGHARYDHDPERNLPPGMANKREEIFDCRPRTDSH